MKLRMKLTALLAALVLAAVPAVALASGQPSDPGSQGQGKAKAHGVNCNDQSRKHVKGEKGTPFSRCVVAAAQEEQQS